ncbi:tRNA 2-selenouridine(34) synthase MnmH [Natronospirillum operosum]|uniref:tRNA 2-selenouridine synthase n=1 Tax=Natronospirillum operosum TaxID=2759953 RepID=A0A4Z0W9S8_9GAMM|nr:tRNA 2-selenouridine(34) synthase MnmH [Natronospirillum operosum]TGG90240.1 tRNA 2-selenouridine(34) synthase MnmH [Natronospirillum operosum]
MIIQPQDFASLLLQNRPLMDVRAPVEFARGAFPSARNLPLLDDDQRHQIGLRYAEAGEEAAIALGLELATPATRQARLDAWAGFIERHPGGALYCFRGGLRSRTTQEWLQAEGLDYPLVRGGYKALRRFLLDQMQALIERGNIRTLAGPTGSGKTQVVHAWPQSVDLEGLARHKGSAFGREFVPQPSQIDWEHAMTLDWLRRRDDSSAPVLMEDESRLIGRIHLPPELQVLLQSAPEIRLEASLQQRVERLREDYVMTIVRHYQHSEPGHCWQRVADHIGDNLTRIRKRLGGARHQALLAAVPDAVAALRDHGDWGGFDGIIRSLLQDYYDPMYQYQLTRYQRRQVFTGTHDEVLAWLADQDGDPLS